MSTSAEKKSLVANKLALVCALTVSAWAFADSGSSVEKSSYPKAESLIGAPIGSDILEKISLLISSLEQNGPVLDRVYADIQAGRLGEDLLKGHPFAMMSEMFGRALSEIKGFKGTGELGINGDKLILLLAEMRYKSDRNANLIRQICTDPKPYVSSIDREGLVALAKLGRENSASFNS